MLVCVYVRDWIQTWEDGTGRGTMNQGGKGKPSSLLMFAIISVTYQQWNMSKKTKEQTRIAETRDAWKVASGVAYAALPLIVWQILKICLLLFQTRALWLQLVSIIYLPLNYHHPPSAWSVSWEQPPSPPFPQTPASGSMHLHHYGNHSQHYRAAHHLRKHIVSCAVCNPQCMTLPRVTADHMGVFLVAYMYLLMCLVDQPSQECRSWQPQHSCIPGWILSDMSVEKWPQTPRHAGPSGRSGVRGVGVAITIVKEAPYSHHLKSQSVTIVWKHYVKICKKHHCTITPLYPTPHHIPLLYHTPHPTTSYYSILHHHIPPLYPTPHHIPPQKTATHRNSLAT